MLKLCPRGFDGVTIGETVFTKVYIGKNIFKILSRITGAKELKT
jgi:hypothetical protein